MRNQLLIALALFSLASCSKVAYNASDDQIRFQFFLPETKANASSFESGDAVSLYAVEYDGSVQIPLQIGGNIMNNERITFNGTQWNAERTLYWGNQPCDFYALYPYQPEVTSIERYPFALAIDQNDEGYEVSDLLFAKAEHVSHSDGPVQLQFKHMMSKVVVNLHKGGQFEGDIPNDVVAHIYNTTTSCTVNWQTGSVEKDVFGTKKTLTMRKIRNDYFEAVVVPQNIEKRTPLIELTMGGIAYLLETSISFRPGYVYTIDITLNTSPDQEQIEISIDPGVNNWN